MEDLFAVAKDASVNYPVQEVGEMLAAVSGTAAVAGAGGLLSNLNLTTISIMVGSIGTVITTAVILSSSGVNENTNQNVTSNPEPAIVVAEQEPKEFNPEQVSPKTIVFNPVEEPVISDIPELILEEPVEEIAQRPEPEFMKPIFEEPEEEIDENEGISLASPGPEGKDLGYFHSVHLGIRAEVHIKQSSGEGKSTVELKADEELKEAIEVKVDNGVLKIKLKEDASRKIKKEVCNRPIAINLTMSEVKEIEISGSGDVHGVGKLKSDDLKIQINGNGDVTFDDISPNGLNVAVFGSGDVSVHGNGKVKKGKIDIHGSGDVCTGDNVVSVMDINIMGSGDVNTSCSDELSISIMGSGDVNYSGTPKLKLNTSGSGEVNSCDRSDCGDK